MKLVMLSKDKGNDPVDLGKPTALIIDDQASICTTLAGIFSDEGWSCLTAGSGKDGIDLYKKNKVDMVLLDVWMKGLDGISTLQILKSINANIPIVIMSGHGTIETAVKATKLGAFDYLEKPLSLEKLLPMIEHAQKTRSLRVSEPLRHGAYELIGGSDATSAIQRQIRVVAPRNSWVLITGENGSGKEVVARNIHLHSLRSEKAFVAVNCAAIPEDLIESELFGHKKGAFTNAIADKIGKFELAHQGTLFLDEIGDMSLKTQAKILRILQEQSFERLGDTKSISIDVRVIAATNKDLQQEIKLGTFREDLYYRLNVIPMHLLPLRKRREDVPILAAYFLQVISTDLAEPLKKIDAMAMAALKNYNWPGNVRELKNLIERLCIMVVDQNVMVDDLPDYIFENAVREEGETQPALSLTLREARNEFERRFIISKLEECDFNVSKTAEIIGLERSNLHRKLKNYGIDTKTLKL